MPTDKCPKSALRLNVAGYQHSKWTVRMKARFIGGLRDIFTKLSNAPINPQTGETLSEEATKLSAKTLKHAEARLDAPSIENQQKSAEIEKTFDEREKLRAEARKMDAETRQITVEIVGKKIDNAAALLELYEKLEAFQSRTGKKIEARILGEIDHEIIVIPERLVAFLEETISTVDIIDPTVLPQKEENET